MIPVFIHKSFLFAATVIATLSCSKVHETPAIDPSSRVSVSFNARSESESTKVTLDFSKAQNVQWSDEDLVAVFDGAMKNEFGIDPGTNTGSDATFSGEVAKGATDLYAVYPYSAAGSLSGSALTVIVPGNQVIGSNANAAPSALVSVGKVNGGSIEFKQVCGLMSFTVSGSNIKRIIISGNALAGAASVNSSGVLQNVSSPSDNITLTCENGGCFVPGRTYYAAVLPGTTAAGRFVISYETSDGAANTRTASRAVTFTRRKGMDAGAIDSGSQSSAGGYLFAYTGMKDGDNNGDYYKMFYAISRDGLSWTVLCGGAPPLPTYYGFPYITQDNDGKYWLIGTDNGPLPHHPVIWHSDDAVSWVRKDLPASIMKLPSGYTNDTNSYGAMKIFFDPVSEQFIITWHASESGLDGDEKWESMRTFYILTRDFESFTTADKLFSFSGSDANMAQIDATIHYYGGKYYAVIKDERTKDSSSSYYKRPRIASSTSLTSWTSNPGGAITPKYREAPTLVKSPDGNYYYMYVEYYEDHVYELYRSTSLTTSNWTKVSSFVPPTGTGDDRNCRHGCVIRVDERTYRRLQTADFSNISSVGESFGTDFSPIW